MNTIVSAEIVGINIARTSSFDFFEGIISCMIRYIIKMPEPNALPVPVMNTVEDKTLDNISFLHPLFDSWQLLQVLSLFNCAFNNRINNIKLPLNFSIEINKNI